MKKTKTVLLSVLAVGIGQIFLKYGLKQLGGVTYSLANLGSTLASIFSNPAILAGTFLFALSSLLWLLAISETDLSYAYPLLGFGYALVAFLSWLIFSEVMPAVRIVGIFIITTGIILMSRT